MPTSTARRPKRDPAKTRAGILKAAVAEFAAKGYSGARTEQIVKRAKTNIRMLYHYFGGKDGLYVCVLEEVLAKLRTEELKLDVADTEPLDGVLQMFDFIDGHFARHPELRNLLAFENLNRAQHLKQSARSPRASRKWRPRCSGCSTGCWRAAPRKVRCARTSTRCTSTSRWSAWCTTARPTSSRCRASSRKTCWRPNGNSASASRRGRC
jgi:AcrR family transcriptional regulator